MNVEAGLTDEIKKWSKRLDGALPNIRPSDDRGTKMLENIKAYRKDSDHFFKRGDLVKSFECLVWAWAILELGKEMSHLK